MKNGIVYYPLTNPQQGIWFTEKMYPGTSLGNIAGTGTIKGRVDRILLEKAINTVVEKNDPIRLRISDNTDEPRQYVSEYKYINFDFFDFTGNNIDEVHKWEEAETRKPFQLVNSDLFYFAILKISDADYRFYVKTHHLISDAWTMSLITNQILDNYSKYIRGDTDFLEKPSYLEYIIKEQNYLNSEKINKDMLFWNQIFKDVPEISTLKTNNADMKSTAAKRKPFAIPTYLASKITNYCLANRISVFTFFLSILVIYLNRITQKDNIVIGIPVLNRSNHKEKDMLGMFISTIPIRIKIDDNQELTSFIKKVSKEWLISLKHHAYPYKLLIRDIRNKNKDIKNLYDIVISYQNARFKKDDFLYDFEGKWHFNGYQKDPLYIHINDRESDGRFWVDYDYLTQFFSVKSIEYIHKHMLVILKDAMLNPHKTIFELDVLQKNEKGKILYEFNNTKSDYSKDKTIHQLFEEQVTKTPDSTAVVFEDKSLTYKELNVRANQLALTLRNMGVKPNNIIGITVSRSLEMIIGLMAILKAGGAYLPIDPDYPRDRIDFMLNNSETGILITDKIFNKNVNFKGKVIDIQNYEMYSSSKSNLENINKADDLGYVLYTSGSTGLPKGVAIKRSSLNNLIYGINRIFDFSDLKSILCMTTISFDIFVFETLIPLTGGLTVIVANSEQQRIPRLLCNLIKKHSVDIIQTTPSRMQSIISDENSTECIESFNNLSIILLGGEPFTNSLYGKLAGITKAKIYNGYGPTETTVYSTIKHVTGIKELNIGRPISNTQIYILDKHLNILPAGTTGELYISGDGLGKGYINNDNLTKERFVLNPFEKGKLMYKTGDLARWTQKGDIEYIGRTDHQVKIRGIRIELQEIENQILRNSTVKEALVVDTEDSSGKKYLCAYLVADDMFDTSELKNLLSKYLPMYMIPSYFIKIDKIPLSPNGKVDRSQLPEPDIDTNRKTEYKPPSGPIEEKLCEIWSKYLNIEKISIYDNIFELGGDSLTIISIATSIFKEFDIEISVEELYKLPTLKSLGEYIEKAVKNKFLPITPAENKEYYQLSSAQKRLYVLSQLEDISIAYNTPWVMISEKSIDRTKVESTFNYLIQRHESLRTGFELIDGTPVQKVYNNKTNFKIEYFEVKENEVKNIIKKFIRPFELNKPPLLRAGLIKLSGTKYIFMFDMHHIISDGTSVKILLREFADIYGGKILPKLKIQYKDYSEWQIKLLKTEAIRKQEEYWEKTFSDYDEIPALNIPCDYRRPPVQSFDGDRVSFRAGINLTDKLKKLALTTGTTLYMLLLAAYNVLLAKYSSQDDIIVGSPVAGRNHSDLQEVIGVFINTLALRNKPQGNKAFTDFLSEVKESSVKAFSNQDYPFEELVGKLKLKRELNRNPLFDTMFTMQSGGLTKLETESLKLITYDFEYNISKFDLMLGAVEEKNEILFAIDYCKKLFMRDTIKRLSMHFINILNAITENPNLKLMDIDMLSTDEKHQILYDFNNTKTDYPSDKTLQEIFEEQAKKTPDGIAIVYGDKKLTYRELNQKSNQIAVLLRKMGAKPNSIVGITARRSLEMMTGIMGILKSGAAYLPIDPEYPEERINYIIKDSGISIVLVQNKQISNLEGKVKTISLEDSSIYKGKHKNPKIINRPEDLCYVIYTSGSTGHPKGVMIEHSSVINRINWMQKKYPLNNTDVILQKTPYTFDVSVWELFWWFFAGAKLSFLPPENEKEPGEIINAIEKYKITIIHFVPSMLNIFLEFISEKKDIEKLSTLKRIFVSGEILSIKLLEDFNKSLYTHNSTKLHNLYGPTEATVDVSYFDCPEKNNNMGTVPIGKPIDNIRIYILDNNLKLQPIRVPGEIYISGLGVGRGYLNKPDLTSETFIRDIFFKEHTMYKTGDIGRWLSDGNIEFLGRTDRQIKIRGMRIELDEIENQLLSHKKIKDAAVVEREDTNRRKYICAYMVTDYKVSVSNIKTYLLELLPDYMIPTHCTILDKLPLTSSGKINRKLLPAPEMDVSDTDIIVEPQNEVEKKLVDICSDVLNIKTIGINNNLFEAGADSLSIITIQTRTFPFGWNLTTQDFYRYQTIKELSERIKGKTTNYALPESGNIDISVQSMEEAAAALDTIDVNKCIDNVFLTGATGFLGIHILYGLMSQTSSNVYCLIRSKNNKAPKERLKSLLKFYFNGSYIEMIDKRIFIVNGDITEYRFGLEAEDYAGLGNLTDVVVHTAAKVEHFGIYDDFKNVNVNGTQNIIDFSLEYDKLLYHISTISISGTCNTDSQIRKTMFTENDLYIGQNYMNNIYVRSKFDAEKLIFKAVNKGLNAVVMRLGNLTGRYSDGLFQKNIMKNAFYNRIKSIAQLGIIPEKVLERNVDFTPVDVCSNIIIEILKCNKPVPSVLHLFNDKTVSFSNLLKFLASMDIDIKLMDNESYSEYIKTIAEDKDMHQLLNGIIQDFNPETGFLHNYPIDVDSNITRSFLETLGFEWPQIDIEYIHKIITFMRDSGYLPADV